jgi:hypothetical protein
MPSNGCSPAAGERAKDRRASRRYPVTVGVRYRVSRGGGEIETGFGETVNLSHAGFLFRCAHALPLGAAIEADLDWPGGARRVPRMALRVAGSTVRRQGNCIAVSIQESAFRAMRRDDAADGTGSTDRPAS